MKNKVEDIVIWKKEFPDNYAQAIEYVRKMLENNYYSYTEHDYKDRYIFADIEARTDVITDFEDMERNDSNG